MEINESPYTSASFEIRDTQSTALVTDLQLTSSLYKVFQLSLEIDENLAAEGQAETEVNPYYDAILIFFH